MRTTRPPFWPIRRDDASAVKANRAIRDGEAQPEAAGSGLPRTVGAIERPKDGGKFVGWNPGGRDR